MAKPATGGNEAPGMDRAELKAHIRLARGGPLPFALALGADGAAVLQMHKSKGSALLFQQVKKAVPDGKRHTHGTVSFDPDDPKTAVFNLEKAVSSISRPLVKALKGTGATKVKVLVDGAEVEAFEDPDGESEADAGAAQGHQGQQGQAAHAAGQQDPAQPQAQTQPQAGKDGAVAGQPDARALNAALTGLVKRMMEVVKRDPAQKAELTELAVQAKRSLDGGDLQTAKADIEVFGIALDAAGGAAPQQAGGGRQDGAHGASHPAAPAIDKARSAWLLARQRIEGQIGAVTKQFEAAFTDHEMADEISASFKARVDSVLHHLDDALSHKLAEVNKSQDAASRAKLVDDAHKLIARYSQHIGSDTTIKELDGNPFVPNLNLGGLLTGTLAQLSKSIR